MEKNLIWKNIENYITSFNPDAIVSISDDWQNFPNLANQPLHIRSKWITIPTIDENTGEYAYQCAMQNILKMDNSKLISYFTPIYNTGEKLLKNASVVIAFNSTIVSIMF